MAIHRIDDRIKGELDRLMRTKGKHPDGGGLYLQVANPGQASWVWRHKPEGQAKEKWRCIGPANAYTIAEAREKARMLRVEVVEKRDPFQLLASRRAEAAGKTFATAVAEYLAVKSPTWAASNRARELRRYEFLFGQIPDFTALPIKAIDQDAKNKALATWQLGSKQRRDVSFYIEAIIRYAETGKIRLIGGGVSGEVEHHPAMPWREVPAFYQGVAELDSVDARALLFTILTGARTDEAIGRKERGLWVKARPTWREITDVDGQPTWVIPGRLTDDAENFRGMKGKKAHRVPLSSAAVALLGERRADNVPLFEVSSANAMLNTLKANGGENYTVHGMRSSLSDWIVEVTGNSREFADMCIAHETRGKVTRAYQRSDLLEKRREVMKQWSDFLARPSTT